MLSSGIVIIMGLTFLFVKLPKRKALWLLGHHLTLDVVITVLVLFIHWGTFSGVMAAAAAGMMCSVFTTGGRKIFGFIDRGVYTPGWVTVKGVNR